MLLRIGQLVDVRRDVFEHNFSLAGREFCVSLLRFLSDNGAIKRARCATMQTLAGCDHGLRSVRVWAYGGSHRENEMQLVAASMRSGIG